MSHVNLTAKKIAIKGYFTDLESFGGKLYLVYREAETHQNSPEGRVAIIRQSGKTWQRIETLHVPRYRFSDVRDPKICTLPNGELLVIGTVARLRFDKLSNGKRTYKSWRYSTVGWKSTNGTSWSYLDVLAGSSSWLWSLHTNSTGVYSVSYLGGVQLWKLDLASYKFQRIANFGRGHTGSNLFGLGNEGETAITTRPNKEMLSLIHI